MTPRTRTIVTSLVCAITFVGCSLPGERLSGHDATSSEDVVTTPMLSLDVVSVRYRGRLLAAPQKVDAFLSASGLDAAARAPRSLGSVAAIPEADERIELFDAQQARVAVLDRSSGAGPSGNGSSADRTATPAILTRTEPRGGVFSQYELVIDLDSIDAIASEPPTVVGEIFDGVDFIVVSDPVLPMTAELRGREAVHPVLVALGSRQSPRPADTPRSCSRISVSLFRRGTMVSLGPEAGRLELGCEDLTKPIAARRRLPEGNLIARAVGVPNWDDFDIEVDASAILRAAAFPENGEK